MNRNNLFKKLQIKYPIIQAPMAGGITTPALVEASIRAGVLGMFGAGYLTAEALKSDIRKVTHSARNKTGVNLFIPQTYSINNAEIQRMMKLLQPYYDYFQIDSQQIELGDMKKDLETFNAQLDVVISEEIPVVSFTFGAPEVNTVQKLQAAHIFVIGTATNLLEAQLLIERGVDALVIQGYGAGGHQAQFINSPHQESLSTLLQKLKDTNDVLLIASGGIMTREDILEAHARGADAVQMGTAFLLTEESGAHPLHKQAINKMTYNETVMTKVFSGKKARGVKNTFIKEMTENEADLLPYPLLNRLTKPIRSAAKAQNNTEFLSLWAGEKAHHGKIQSVQTLVSSLQGDDNA